MRLPMHLKTVVDRTRGRRHIVRGQPEAHGLRGAARRRARARACRIAAAAAGSARVHRDGADCDCAVGDPRCGRSRRATEFQRQGRQSDIADPGECRHRLDRLARADHRHRRPGRVVAGDAADGNAQRHGLAVGEGNRRRRRCAGRPARRQCRQADRQHQHQEPQRQRRDQGQRRHHRAAEDRRQLADRAESRRPGQSRRHQPHRSRRARERAGTGQAADRQECR